MTEITEKMRSDLRDKSLYVLMLSGVYNEILSLKP